MLLRRKHAGRPNRAGVHSLGLCVYAIVVLVGGSHANYGAVSVYCAATRSGTVQEAHLLTLPPAVENTALNVVCNQEYAQAVNHVRHLRNACCALLISSICRYTTISYLRRSPDLARPQRRATMSHGRSHRRRCINLSLSPVITWRKSPRNGSWTASALVSRM